MSDNYCPFCGSVMKIGDEFCNSCGANLLEKTDPAQSQTLSSQQSTQQQYPPPPKTTTHQYGASAKTIYVQPNKTENQTNSLGIISLIVSFIGFISIFIFPFLSPIFFIAGLITGVIGMGKPSKGVAIGGLILSAIGIILSIIAIIVVIVLFASFSYMP